MTGIERLRELGNGISPFVEMVFVTLSNYCIRHNLHLAKGRDRFLRDNLLDIADQIAREHAEDAKAVAWVREHGGLSQVKMDYDVYEGFARLVDRVAARLGVSVEGLDAQDSEPIVTSALDHRLMPEGMEWPMVGGEPVAIGERLVGYGSGDDGYEVVGVRPTCGWVLVKSHDHIHRDGGPVILEWDASKCHRPAPKVLDADGVEIREGDTVWHVETGEQCKVVEVDSMSVSVDFRVGGDGAKHTGSILPANLTHRAPVLAADGRPLREGETVWGVHTHTSYVVSEIKDGEVLCRFADAKPSVDFSEFAYQFMAPTALVHERPDSLERIDADVRDIWNEVRYHLGDYSPSDFKEQGDSVCDRIADLPRRIRALAGGA